MQFYTYMWLREDGTPYYIGKGKAHRAFYDLDHNIHCPRERERILVEYHRVEVDALFAEMFFIAYFGRIDLGTGCLRNLTNGGENMQGISPVSRKKQGDKLRGIPRPAYVRKAIGDAHRGKSYHTLEFRQRLSVLMKGKPAWNKGKVGIYSEATLQKMRKPKSEEHKAKMSHNGMLGKRHSEETLQKMRKPHKRKLLEEAA